LEKDLQVNTDKYKKEFEDRIKKESDQITKDFEKKKKELEKNIDLAGSKDKLQ